MVDGPSVELMLDLGVIIGALEQGGHIERGSTKEWSID
jgi:hypothetical protein